MTYWIPPPLPLPRGTRNLFWNKGPLDQAAAWFWCKRIYLAKPKRKDADPNPDLATVSEAELNALRCVRSHSYHRDTWMRATSWRTRGAYSSEWADMLPFHTLPEGFFVIAVPFVDASSHDYEDPDRNAKSFLIGRTVGERFQIYPRSLRARGWQSKAGTILKARSITALAPAWTEGFDALPAWSATPEDVHAGKPTLAATMSGRDVYESMGKEAHPYWANAANALIAALCLEGVRPPQEDERSYSLFHWTVFSPRFELSKPAYEAMPLRVEIAYDGFKLLANDPSPSPTPQEADALRRISRALETVLTAFAPNDPLFFDTLASPDGHSASFTDYSFAKSSSFTGTGQHFPWIRGEDMKSAETAHGALRALQRLPSSWREALTAALDAQRT